MAERDEQTRTTDQVARALQEKERAIEGRVDALQEEFGDLVPALGRSMLGHPLVSVGGALAAGLAVGLLFGGRSARRGPDHRALMEAYVASVAEEAHRRVRRGQEPEDAVRRALDGRVPLIVYEAEAAEAPRGPLRQAVRIVVRSALGFGMTAAFNFLTAFLQAGGAPTPSEAAAESAVATAAVAQSMDG
ncbi:MAG: hypothetical protein R3247_00790 [Rhodothermales bacterium]|nr:hypothetical protein [Rhodothermales bacterium]